MTSPTQPNVLAAVPDLFFASRLSSLAAQANVVLTIVNSETEFARKLSSSTPDLVLIDLGARPFDPVALIREAKRAAVPKIVAFGPHKDLAARLAALDAGADQWITNQRLGEVFTQ
jgi:DNA-binding response OmpR family regulator